MYIYAKDSLVLRGIHVYIFMYMYLCLLSIDIGCVFNQA